MHRVNATIIYMLCIMFFTGFAFEFKIAVSVSIVGGCLFGILNDILSELIKLNKNNEKDADSNN